VPHDPQSLLRRHRHRFRGFRGVALGAQLDDVNRTLFALAAYNCGPGNMAKLRKTAEARGLNPNVWFNNVEIVTAERIGIETTMYVRNIYKCYVAYKLMADAQAAQKAAREAIK
jgi:membrane-bound lytic murein transglycosylase MltF